MIEKQSIQAMAVENESKTADEGSCVMRMCIAASGQSHPLTIEAEDDAYMDDPRRTFRWQLYALTTKKTTQSSKDLRLEAMICYHIASCSVIVWK